MLSELNRSATVGIGDKWSSGDEACWDTDEGNGETTDRFSSEVTDVCLGVATDVSGWLAVKSTKQIIYIYIHKYIYT